MMRIVLLLILFSPGLAFTQLRYKFKQYMLHQTIYNPGFVDTDSKFSANMLYRRQWLRQENFPEAIYLYGHYNINANNGLGFLLSNDLLNKFNQFEVGVNYVYNIPFGDHYNLGLGVKAAFNEQNLVNGKLTYFDPEEPVLAGGDFTHQFFNAGAGISLSSKTINFHLGLPYLFGNTVLNPAKTYTLKANHFYTSLGYKFRFSDWFILYPYVMVNAVGGSEVHVSTSLNVLQGQLFWYGLGFDSDYTASASVGLFLLTGLRLAYTYDIIYFTKHQTTGVSHEVSISYAKTIRDNPFSKRKTGRNKFRRMGRSPRK